MHKTEAKHLIFEIELFHINVTIYKMYKNCILSLSPCV